MRLVGIVTAKDILEKPDKQSIERVMTKDPIFVKREMSIASVSHQMIWDGLEVMAVVSDDLTLVGLVSRQDVMKAMQLVQRQTQMSDTISDQIAGEIQLVEESEGVKKDVPEFVFAVTPQMVNEVGTIAFGVLSEIISNVTKRTLYFSQRRNTWIEQMNLHYFRLIQLESQVVIKPRILEMGRRSAKLDIEVYMENTLVAKALVVCQLLERP